MELFSNTVGQGLTSLHVQPEVISLVTDGIIAGVGGMLTFLAEYFYPVSGAGISGRQWIYVQSGLCHGRHHGKSGAVGSVHFCPMVLGFGCTVPAIMASRALENGEGPVLETMLVTPFMSCSRQTADLCLVFGYVFWKACDDRCLFHVCDRTFCSHWYCCDPSPDRQR